MEKRGFQRLPAEAEVVIRDAPAGVRCNCQSKNISGSGILLSCPTNYEPGTLLEIEVLTTTHKTFSHAFPPLRALVRVVRIEGTQAPYDLAAAFVEIHN